MLDYFEEIKARSTADETTDNDENDAFDEDDEPAVSTDPDNFKSVFITDEEETDNEVDNIAAIRTMYNEEESDNEEQDIFDMAGIVQQSLEEEEQFESSDMYGGGNKSTVHIIYSFVPSIATKLTRAGANIYNLGPCLNQLVKQVYLHLPNVYTSSKKVLAKLITAIDKTIMRAADNHRTLFFPVTSKLSSFDIYYFFNYLTRKDMTHNYMLTVVNADVPLMMSRIRDEFDNSPYRITLIRSCAAISKHYARSTASQSSDITVTKQDISNVLGSFKSTFSDKQEQMEFIDSMMNIIFNGKIDDTTTMTQQIVCLPYKNMRIVNVSSTDSDAEIARKLIQLDMKPSAKKPKQKQ